MRRHQRRIGRCRLRIGRGGAIVDLATRRGIRSPGDGGAGGSGRSRDGGNHGRLRGRRYGYCGRGCGGTVAVAGGQRIGRCRRGTDGGRAAGGRGRKGSRCNGDGRGPAGGPGQRCGLVGGNRSGCGRERGDGRGLASGAGNVSNNKLGSIRGIGGFVTVEPDVVVVEHIGGEYDPVLLQFAEAEVGAQVDAGPLPGAGGRDRGQTRAAVAAGGRPRGAGFVVVPVDGVGIPIGFGDLLGVDEIGATLLVILLYLKLHVGDGSADAQVFEADDHLLARIRGAVLQPDGERIHGAAAGIDIVGIAAADVDFVILAACISVSPVLEGNRDRL